MTRRAKFWGGTRLDQMGPPSPEQMDGARAHWGFGEEEEFKEGGEVG